MRALHSVIGVCLVLLFAAFGQINAVDNLQHVGLTEHHKHSVLSSVTMLEDHEHHSGEPVPLDHPEHAHPNLLGNVVPTIVPAFEAVTLRTDTAVLAMANEAPVIGHLQQAPDRPPKHSL